MDADLEAKVRTCTECQSSRPPPASYSTVTPMGVASEAMVTVAS